MHNGLALPNQPQAPVSIASPLNDVQMVALLAALPRMGDSNGERVANAMDLLAESFVQCGGGRLKALFEQKAQERMGG